MGLGDLSSDDNGDEQSGSKREYVVISREEFEEFLESRREDWQVANHPSQEIVYGTRDIIEYDDLAVLIFSTIDKRTNNSRKKGADAIRTTIFHIPSVTPVGGRKKTLRIKTWRKNLGNKIDSIHEEYEQYIDRCDECGGFMVERDGKHGKFLGCINYPDCKNTKSV